MSEPGRFFTPDRALHSNSITESVMPHERNTPRVCSFPDCGRGHDANGLCKGHATQVARNTPLRPLQVRQTDSSRFWSKVNKDGPTQPHMDTPCWVWMGAPATGGYGRATLDKRETKAHRVAYEIANGAIPPELLVCHACDYPPCVRPDHLWAGTTQQNTADMVAKGRSQHRHGGPKPARLHRRAAPRGAARMWAKLTDESVRAIRERHAIGGVTWAELATKYGVSRTSAYRAGVGDTWDHVVSKV